MEESPPPLSAPQSGLKEVKVHKVLKEKTRKFFDKHDLEELVDKVNQGNEKAFQYLAESFYYGHFSITAVSLINWKPIIINFLLSCPPLSSFTTQEIIFLLHGLAFHQRNMKHHKRHTTRELISVHDLIDVLELRANNDDPDALSGLALIYQQCLDGDKKEQKKQEMQAQVMFLKAAKLGSTMAEFHLGHTYYNKKNYKEAFKWFKKASKNDIGIAHCLLSYMYLFGQGTERDASKFLYHLDQAVLQKIPQALYTLGILYLQGILKEKNDVYAAELQAQAAKLGLPEAQSTLKLMKHQGIGGVDFHKSGVQKKEILSFFPPLTTKLSSLLSKLSSYFF